jgi:peptidoglycan/LPS O-acetylase OafA/YrhL
MTKVPATTSSRVHWVDWLKVLAVAAIFLYHVALVFSITPWMVSNQQKSLILSGIAGWGYLWGLQLLFVLAGASSYYALRRRSAIRFAGERLLRLGVPLVVGLVTLSPLQAYFMSLAQGHRQTFLEFLPGFLHRLTPPLDPVWLIRSGYHLWFLGFLLVISIAALPVLATAGRLARRLRLAPPVAIFLPIVPIALLQVLLRPVFPPDMSWPDLASDLVFYIGGYALAASPEIAREVRRTAGRNVVVALAAWCGLGLTFLARAVPGWNHPQAFDLVSLAYQVLHAAGAWFWILFLTGMAMRWLDRPHRAITYGNDAILPFYVLHHPVVVVLAYYIVQLQIGVWPKFGLLFTGAAITTLAIYEVAIRHVGPLRFLFGLKYKPADQKARPGQAGRPLAPPAPGGRLPSPGGSPT